jgi:hypothetical protein
VDRIGTALLSLLLFAAPSFAATAGEKCAAAKTKAAGQKLYRKTKCHSKALARSTAVDADCLSTAEQKFSTAFSRAEAKGGCVVSGDSGTVETSVDDCLATLLGAISGDARCTAAKVKAVGKEVKSEAKCYRKAILADTTVDPTCLATAGTKLATAVGKADALGSCTDTATSLDALVDGCAGDLHDLIGDGSPQCTLADNTTATGTVNPNGCAVLDRDASACQAARQAAGLSGYWLKFSCRVTLSQSGGNVVASADGQPDYKSNYFQTTDPCYETYAGGIQNPNHIVAQSYSVAFPTTPNTTAQPMSGAVVGLALNGVPIFGNFAAPGDDIYQEAQTFDRCGAHPQENGKYHYHGEPYAISYDDDNFIGVMRDGYPIYGRRDPDNSYPTLDSYGGHTGVTVDSPSTPVYHYHLNLQTSTNPGTAGEMQWFLTTGTYRGTPAACATCN